MVQADPAQIPQQHRILPSAGPGREGRGWRGQEKMGGHSPHINTSETPVMPRNPTDSWLFFTCFVRSKNNPGAEEKAQHPLSLPG